MQIEAIKKIVGAGNVLTGAEAAPYGEDWTKRYVSTPLAVARPGSTDEVSRLMALAHETGTAVVPASGRTGLAGGTYAEGALLISMERMNKIREIRADARLAILEAGVVLANLHAAAEAEDLVFPLTFGAKGSAMIGGALSTNAGGSNVVRYGSTRGLCLGLEVVLADGRVMDLMSELHKDNSGYDLKDLFIGGEGTLGLITGAVVRLFPKPSAYATAMVATADLEGALTLLNAL
ncbi:MAG: FAD-binding oxidoreductase, partial [Pseudomonadota bacterium]